VWGGGRVREKEREGLNKDMFVFVSVRSKEGNIANKTCIILQERERKIEERGKEKQRERKRKERQKSAKKREKFESEKKRKRRL
jgi:hypothetical protein